MQCRRPSPLPRLAGRSARRPAAAVAPVAVTTRGAAASTMGAESRAAYRLLHDALIAPLRADLPAAGSPVTIVPHGPLFRLSFAALANKAGRYLLEDYGLQATRHRSPL